MITRWINFSFFLKSIGAILLIFFLISITFALPSYILVLLALIWLFYVPLAIGNLFFGLPLNLIRNLWRYTNSLGIYSILIVWFVGVFIISLVSFAAYYTQINIASHAMGPILLASGFLLSFVPVRNKIKLRLDRSHVKIIAMLLLVGISFGLYVRSYSPYPLSPGMDIFTHVYTIKSILNSSIQDVPLVYAPVFDMLLALSSDTFNADLIILFWVGPILLFALFSLSYFSLSRRIIKNNGHAFLGTLFGLAFTEMGFASNLQFLFPASFVMSIFPLTFLAVDTIWNRLNRNKIFSIISTLIIFSGLVVNHFQLGIVASFMMSVYLILGYYMKRNEFFDYVIRLTTISITSILLLYFFGLINTGLYTTPELVVVKVKNLKEFYTDIIMAFSLFGLVALSLFKERKAAILGFIASVILLIYFQRHEFIQRVLPLERPLLAFSASALIALPIIVNFKMPKIRQRSLLSRLRLGSGFKTADVSDTHYDNLKGYQLRILNSSRGTTKLTVIFVIFIVLLLFPIFMKPYDLYIGAYSELGYPFANFTDDEMVTSKWIDQNMPKDYNIYSDPFTVVEMRGLAYRQNIEGIGWNTTVKTLVKYALSSDDAAYAYNNIVSNFGPKVAIVISPRTSEWVHTSDLVQFPIKDFAPFKGFDKFFNKKYFKVEYRYHDIFVFTLA
jgi:hypothetical protein